MPRIFRPTEPALREAVRALRSGGVVGMPTETVYGLAADTFNVTALQRVYAMKGRPADNPLIAHVLDSAQARQIAAGWDGRCEALAERFWPGPLTMVLERAADVPAMAAAGLETIAVRSPAHAVARALLSQFGGPLSAPSANRSGRVSPTTAQHVADDFADEIDLLILDGGPCAIGIESTVLDMSGERPRVLRPGAVTMDSLREVLGDVESSFVDAQAASPGTSMRHYAPRTPCEVVASDAFVDRLREMRERVVVLCFDSRHVTSPHEAIVMPRGPEQYAAKLYVALREADSSGAARILIERPPAEPANAWAAIHDRLRRASASHAVDQS